LKISASSILLALRCTPKGALGLDVATRFSDISIKLLESKSVGGPGCGIEVRPHEFRRCTAADTDPHTECYRLAGTALSLYGYSGLFNGAPTRFEKLGD